MKIFNKLLDLFRSPKELREIATLTEKMQRNLALAHNEYTALREMYAIMADSVHGTDGFIWRKDRDGRYLFANRAFCNTLLVPDRQEISTTGDCTSQIVGYTDDDIMGQYAMRTGDINSYWTTFCIASKYVMKTKARTKMIEFGEIKNNPVAIESIRTPIFTKNGEVDGILGYALDKSDQCNMLWEDIKKWHRKGYIINIHPSIFVINNRNDDRCCAPNDFFDFDE